MPFFNIPKEKKPLFYTFLVLIFILLLKLSFVFSSIDFGVDESHYALYAKYPALSYFDHPPMVGWTQLIPYWTVKKEWAFRLVPVILSFISSLLLYAITRKILNNDSHWIACLSVIFACSQFISFANVLNTPQSSYILFSLLFMYFYYDILFYENSVSLSHWIIFGVITGFAGLSYYGAVLLIISALLLLILNKKLNLLLNYKLWISIAIAIIVVSPVFIWNMQHDFISFKYQVGHGFGAHDWKFMTFLKSQSIQFLAYSPLIFIFGYYSLYKFTRYYRLERSILYLLCFIFPMIILFAYSSGYKLVLAHWVSFSWFLISILIAKLTYDNWEYKNYRIYCYVTVIVGIIPGIILSMLILFPGNILYLFQKFIPNKLLYKDIYGWKEAAIIAKNEIQNNPQLDKKIFVPSWINAARISWYSELPTQVIGTDKIYQFDFWYGRAKNGDSGLVLLPYGYSIIYGKNKKNQFESCKLLTKKDIYKYKMIVNKFNFYICYNYRT